MGRPSKLTERQWLGVERSIQEGTSLREAAKKFGTSPSAIHNRLKQRGIDPLPAPAIGAAVLLAGQQDTKAGFVYVIYIDDSACERYFKIGMTQTFSARFGQHQCASPFPICVACAYFVADMRAEERMLHDHFAAKRIRGEWFRLTDDDLTMIASRSRLV